VGFFWPQVRLVLGQDWTAFLTLNAPNKMQIKEKLLGTSLADFLSMRFIFLSSWCSLKGNFSFILIIGAAQRLSIHFKERFELAVLPIGQVIDT